MHASGPAAASLYQGTSYPLFVRALYHTQRSDLPSERVLRQDQHRWLKGKGDDVADAAMRGACKQLLEVFDPTMWRAENEKGALVRVRSLPLSTTSTHAHTHQGVAQLKKNL